MMRLWRGLGLPLFATTLLLCACGGNSQGAKPTQAPSGLSYTSATAVYLQGVAITPNQPSSSGGAVSSYSVSKPLPAGLSLNQSSGVVSGTPNVVAAADTYTITASNAIGSATTDLTITVNIAPPAHFAYTTSAPVYVAGEAIAPNHPISVGGTISSYTVSPALPGALTLNASTGIITGVAPATSSTSPVSTTYTVTAANSSGRTSTRLTITLYNALQSVPNTAQWITPLAAANSTFESLDTGMVITDPLNSQIPPVEWMAGQASNSAVSPDGKTLLVLTSGYNRVFQSESLAWDPALSTEYVFVYDISNHVPIKKQVVPIPNSYIGLAWDPSGAAFYVSSGMGDWPYSKTGDNVHIITRQADGSWAQNKGAELLLNHNSGNGLPVPNNGPVPVNSQIYVYPCAAGIALSNDGQKLVVANYYNDSITIFSGGLGKWSKGTELDLRPGKSASNPQTGTPGGEYPFAVQIAGDGSKSKPYTAYISSIRDREIDVVSLSATPVVSARIPVKGQPNKIVLNKAQTLLYVAEDQSDTVDIIDLDPVDTGEPGQHGPGTLNTVIERIPVIALPADLQSFSLTQYTGANTNSLALSPDEKYLYVTNGNLNSVAVVALSGNNTGDEVIGLIPTGWYPTSVTFSKDGAWAYVTNQKAPTGPNPQWCYAAGPAGYPGCQPTNHYNPQLIKAGLQSFPTAAIPSQLSALSAQVVANDRFSNTSSAGPIMQAVHAGVQHVIFVLKENRTYDQILGDLPVGNGDPALALFGSSITPNLHALAQTFVTLDNFMCTSEVSNDGWMWSTGARANDVIERETPVTYAQRGLSLDSTGKDRSINVGVPTVAERQKGDPLTPDDPDLLPGQNDVSAPDGPNDELNTGYLWDAALRAGLTVRSYGFFVDETCYTEPSCLIPLAPNPFSTKTVVGYPASASLAPYTDPYFRGFDNSYPDFYRYKEWERDFDANYATGGLPALSLVRFMHDHTGNFSVAIDGVNTPFRQEADNDYAVGLLIEKIANSVYKDNTLIFVVEDDAQDGGDHMDSHRAPAYIAGAYVKQGAVVSTAYNTIDYVRTMEEVLGLAPMNLNDALANPMTDVFNSGPSAWTFTATPANILYCTSLPLPRGGPLCNDPTPDAKYWSEVTKGMDFRGADRLDGKLFNRVLWKGLMGHRPYPASPSGKNLRQNREELLKHYRETMKQQDATR